MARPSQIFDFLFKNPKKKKYLKTTFEKILKFSNGLLKNENEKSGLVMPSAHFQSLFFYDKFTSGNVECCLKRLTRLTPLAEFISVNIFFVVKIV